MFASSEGTLEKKAGALEEMSRLREAEKETKLREARQKAAAKAAAYRRMLISKLVAPIILLLTVVIGLILWLIAH